MPSIEELLKAKERLKIVVNDYLEKAPEAERYCNLCLSCQRWGGNPVLIVLDAAFTSIGMKYFSIVVPAVLKFESGHVDLIKSLSNLADADIEPLRAIWRNARSWNVAQEMARQLISIQNEMNLEKERDALIYWANHTSHIQWKEDPIGRISGIGINTFQYLRMMGGADTVMPDRIVRQIINSILEESGKIMPVKDEIELIETVHHIGKITDHSPAELCWMCWLFEPGLEKVR